MGKEDRLYTTEVDALYTGAVQRIENVENMVRMRIPKRYQDASLDQISRSSVERTSPSAQSIARRYILRSDEILQRGIGLLLYGDNGRGKTCMAIAVAKYFRALRLQVLFYQAANIRTDIIQNVMFDESTTMLQRLRNVDFLILDDLGKGIQDSVGFSARALDDLLRHRSSEKRITWITTNMTIDSIREELKISTMATMKECIIPVRVVGPDLREKSKNENLAILCD